jgi:membrane protein
MDNPKYTHDRTKTGFRVPEPGIPPRESRKNQVKRIFKRINEDNVSIVSAGIAFFFFLALFPGIAAVVSIYGLIVDVSQVQQHLNQVANVLPAEAYALVSDILLQTAGQSTGTLGWSLVISILLSLWSASKGTSSMFDGVNIAYHEKDERGFIIKKTIILLFTLGVIVAGLISLAFVVAFPAFIDNLGLPSVLQTILGLLRWVILAGIVYFVLEMIYKIAPNRGSDFRWLNPGAIVATILWIGGSLLFTLYVDNFGDYDKTYGSIAAIIILLLWFYLTGFIIMLGAEINAETLPDRHVTSMVGTGEPLGLSGSYYPGPHTGLNKKNHMNGHGH